MQVYIDYDDDVILHVECGWSGKYFSGSREEPPEEPEFDIHDVSYSLDNVKDLDKEELAWYKQCLEKYLDSDRFFKDVEEAARNLAFDDYYD
jgi:hypothetical protein